jgi:hypothetical protein
MIWAQLLLEIARANGFLGCSLSRLVPYAEAIGNRRAPSLSEKSVALMLAKRKRDEEFSVEIASRRLELAPKNGPGGPLLVSGALVT